MYNLRYKSSILVWFSPISMHTDIQWIKPYIPPWEHYFCSSLHQQRIPVPATLFLVQTETTLVVASLTVHESNCFGVIYSTPLQLVVNSWYRLNEYPALCGW